MLIKGKHIQLTDNHFICAACHPFDSDVQLLGHSSQIWIAWSFLQVSKLLQNFSLTSQNVLITYGWEATVMKLITAMIF